MVSLPDARFLFVIKRTRLHQFPILAIPFPLTRHFAIGKSADGFWQSVTQVVLPLSDLLAIAVFADARQSAVFEKLFDKTVLQSALSVEFASADFHGAYRLR